jgi:plasmid replication initiation protein
MIANKYPGTSLDKAKGRWKARITRNGRTHNVGSYPTQEEAYAAVLRAKAAGDAELTASDPKKNTTVAQSNVLAETYWPATLLEARLFVLMLRCLHKNDQEAPGITVPIEELMPGGRGGRNYELLKQAIDRFMSLRIELPTLHDKRDMQAINLVQGMVLNASKDVVVGFFTPLALPYLTALSNNFAVGDVAELLTLQTAASHKMYWLMQAWEFRSPVTVTVDKLRELVVKDNYERYTDFRNRVLMPSIEELNALTFEIVVTENRKGRAVDSLRFDIGRRGKPQQLQLELTTSPALPTPKPKPQLTGLQQKVVTRLQKLKLTDAQIKKVLDVVVGEEQLTIVLKETYPVLRDFETKAKPGENVAAATMALLKSTFPAVWAAN